MPVCVPGSTRSVVWPNGVGTCTSAPRRGLRERDAEIVDEIVAVTLEARIFFDVEQRR